MNTKKQVETHKIRGKLKEDNCTIAHDTHAHRTESVSRWHYW